MTPLKYKDLKVGMIVSDASGRTGRITWIYIDSEVYQIEWAESKTDSLYNDFSLPKLYHPHTTETTYMDGVQVVRLVVDRNGDVWQCVHDWLAEDIGFKTKSKSNSFDINKVMKIDSKISRVRKPS